jgi:signal transduction histidine kinase
MGARPIEARLTARLLGAGGAALAIVSLASIVLTHRVLDDADTKTAKARAAVLRETLIHETRDEGDSPDQALDEVSAESELGGERVLLRLGAATRGHGKALVPGACETSIDDAGKRWRACAVGDDAMAVTAAIPIDGHRAAVVGLAKAMALVLVAAMFLLALAIRRALRAPLEEIHALVDWTSRVGEAEERTVPPAAATREIEQLQAAFDALVKRLLDALARERTVTAHIAHELRTPLTTMFAEIDAAPPSEALTRIRDDAKRVADVVEAILVLSDRSERKPQSAIVNVADVARDLAEGAEVDAPDEALIAGDERLIGLAVRNLVDNARKYAGKVSRVRVSRADDGVQITIVDDGPGLSAQSRAKMFDRYWRGAADGEGRGLGLSLVRAIAERHGGRAEARAGAGERGLEVSMTLRPLVGWHEAR